MWLPKDERYLLLGYYVNIFNIDDRNICRYLEKPKFFEISDWTDVLNKPRWIPILTPLLVQRAARMIKTYGDTGKISNEEDKSVKQNKKENKTYIKLERRLQISNAALERREMIKIQKHEHVSGVSGITLTPNGHDLGGKYSSWWTRSGLWFAEYKNHWIWLIVGFLGGIVGALLVNWLSNGNK
ncbi:MAG: hypothetical protein ACYTBX_12905 [Planctomycetota bacterium]|jgi:hypothetical protein